ncbi:hypothetical protein PR202_ga28374 [Eleusine coracana subsp. coracana]|uniref:Uncharacterized protein n=1 Tax=Eleusine coracana subsp. coracana TaxID=191504 RepID=A0AAV5DIE7_ELECO|nr:hypothetical protein PR202_ga28374 [Eleusine coracana subsp. coracana]
MAAKASSTGEHRVQIIMPRDDDDAGGRREGKKGRKPEKQLNCFVRIVVLIERLGNALGTLAFTWATVILLGGYPTVLRQEDDFCFATIIVFLEAARVRFQRTRSKSGTKHVLTVSQGTFWHRVLLNICMFVELVMLVLVPGHKATQSVMLAYELLALLLVSFGNLQIPAALIRVGLSLLRLVPHDYLGADPEDASKINLTPSLSIFYGMVLGQGILYLAACLLGIFSFIPRRSLARRGGFRGRKGREFVKLYYAYAWDKCMENNVLARKKISLCSFALDSINSEYSPTRQLLGVQLIHKLLQMEPARTRLLSRLNASVETMARIIRMLDWRNPEDTDIRLFAAKVVAELAKSIRVVAVPGMIQLVSALLDANRKPERSSALLDTDDEQEGKQGTVIDAADIQEENQLWDTSKLHESQACSNKQISIDCQGSCFIRFWK